jgi:Mrp family chromosome partitioning ATPase
VASTVGTYTASMQRSTLFRSSTQVFVSDSQIQAIVSGGAAGGTDRSTLDQAKLVVSRPVVEAVGKRLGLRDTPAQLAGSVRAEPIAGSNFVAVTAERGTAAEAAAVANAFVEGYIRFRNEQLSRDAESAIAGIRTQIRNLSSSVANRAQRQALQDTVRELEVAAASAGSQTRQTDRAVAPGAPFSPRPKRDALFAFVIAMGLGVALAFGLERFDRRIKSLDDVTGAYGLPLLAGIPHTSSPNKLIDGLAAVPEHVREPFRTLRVSLQLASLDDPATCLLVTSAISGEGKSTVVRNLALTYREWGLSVAVLEADLRRPTLVSAFGVQADSPGLTGVLTGECTLAEALIAVNANIESLAFLDKVRLGGSVAQVPDSQTEPGRGGKLALLHSGETPPNPPAVLAAAKMTHIIDGLTSSFDIVLIDTPPLLAVSDAFPLLPQADGVILVTRVGLTERPAAQKAVTAARLDPRVSVLGVVANDIVPQPGSGYGYGYGQGYGYSSSNGRKA